MARQEFSAELLELIAAQFKLLSEPLRLRLLDALRDGERTVTSLVAATGATQANVSRHLALLHGHGMLARRKDGLRVYYGIADPVIFRLCELVCDSLEEGLKVELRTVTSGQQRSGSPRPPV